MCRRYSVAEIDILDVLEDARAEVRAQRFRGDYFDATAGEVLEKLRQAHKIVEGLLVRLEHRQHVEVALVVLGPARDRTK